MTTQIQESKDYDKFEMLEFNRDIKKLSNLIHSMRIHGWIDAYPLHVVKNGNSKLKIKAGHHRFTAAEKLGIPIKYVICDDAASIHTLEKATIPWSLEDYVVSHFKTGKKDYGEIMNLHEQTGIGLNSIFSMMAGQICDSNNRTTKIKGGEFSIKDRKHPLKVVDMILFCKQRGVSWANQKSFVQAISSILLVEQMDIERLKSKVANYTSLVKKQPSKDEYIRMLEEVYNFRNGQDRIPLFFLAKESAKKRNPISNQKYISENWEIPVNRDLIEAEKIVCSLREEVISKHECLDLSGDPPEGYDCSDCKHFNNTRNQLLGST
jgi:hypothetical protein